MPYSVELGEPARRQLRTMDKAIAFRIIQKLEEASTSPNHFFKRLSERESFKLRVGDYRIIAQVHHPEMRIWVELIGHRKNIYKHLR